MRVSADNGRTWGQVYTILDNCGTWDIGYQRATTLADNKVFLMYYFADKVNTTGTFNGVEENHKVPRRIVASIFDAEGLSAEFMPINPYRQLEATACDFGKVRYNSKFYITDFKKDSYFQFNQLNFDKGLSAVRIGYASATGGGEIEIRDGSETGKLIGTITVGATGDDLKFSTQEISVTNLKGMHSIFFVSNKDKIANIDFVEFVATKK